MKKKINIGIIGCGNIAHGGHIPNYLSSENAQIKYFCDIIPEKAHQAVEKYGCGTAVFDYHDILNDPELDAVSVCTHNDTHCVISVDFMRAGKDVLCEKPAARVLSEALEMQRVSQETGRILSIGVVNRFSTAVNHIKNLIKQDELGEVYHVYISFRAHRSIPGIGGDFTTKSVSGGGALIDWGVHYIDLAMYCCGEPKPLTASGEAFCKLGVEIKDYITPKKMWAEDSSDLNGTYDVEDSVTGIIRTENPVITVHGAWAQNVGVSETYIDFMGTKGGVRLAYGGNFTLYTIKNGMLLECTPSYRVEDYYKAEIHSFIDSVINHKPNQATIDNCIMTSKIMQAIYDSSKAHREMSIE